jgi:4-alpha-glucanotransferase
MNKPPLFNWLKERGSGVLLHPTCFPGDQGIGTLDHSAYAFVDFLETCKMKYWQVCPLGPTGFGDSPYQTFSAFAGNPYLINLKVLVAMGLIVQKDIKALRFMPGSRTDFGLLYENKWPVLRKAFSKYKSAPSQWKELHEDFEKFKKKEVDWLVDFGLFMALKDNFDGRSWLDWPKQFRSYRSINPKNLEPEILLSAESHQFFQFLFYSQWSKLKTYAKGKGIQIIGDIPIFVAFDSVDVWRNPEFFQVDKRSFKPKAVAGCPPDYFSKDGQFWGNPLYNWDQLKKDGFTWWINRFKASYNLYDIVRIDHFRGFESYWSIRADAKTAAEGKWVKGPGLELFKAIHKAVPQAKIIAEDLGLITPEVRKLLHDTGLPGMAVLQFAFGGDSENLYLPHNVDKNSVIYSSTHDNDTTMGWFKEAGENIQSHVQRYFDVSGEFVSWDFIRSSYRSSSKLAIFPIQDMMDLDSSGRMNEPGKALGNWQWRYQSWQLELLNNESSDYLAKLSVLYGR